MVWRWPTPEAALSGKMCIECNLSLGIWRLLPSLRVRPGKAADAEGRPHLRKVSWQGEQIHREERMSMALERLLPQPEGAQG